MANPSRLAVTGTLIWFATLTDEPDGKVKLELLFGAIVSVTGIPVVATGVGVIDVCPLTLAPSGRSSKRTNRSAAPAIANLI